MHFHFRPKLLDTLPGYGRHAAFNDLLAGLTVGVLALPLAMAFAIASGMSPTAGIWTAIIAGFLISLLGGSRVQIGGPTGAFIPILYGIVMEYGVANLLLATMLAGVMLLAMGLFRLGSMIRFIPVSVVTGFTNGIAVVIFISQIKDFLGLSIENLPGEFFAKTRTLWEALPSFHLPTLVFSSLCLASLLLWNHKAKRFAWMRRLPGPLVVLVMATLVNAVFQFPIETVGSRFGGIPQQLPLFAFPEASLETLGKLIAPALTIALLGAIESLLSARVADNAIHDRHNPNQELMAQGVANIVAPLFGGFAATGAIARTATNVRSGGRTPVAGLIHAGVLLAIVLVAAPLAKHIPLSALAAIVVLVAINMGEWHAFKTLRRYSFNYQSILVSTFVITVIFDLTLAVEVGLVLASLFFIYRMSELTRFERLSEKELQNLGVVPEQEGPPRIVAFRLFGSLFFGASNTLEALLTAEPGQPHALILDMEKVINIDTSGLDILQTFQRSLQQKGTVLLLCDLNAQPASLIRRSGFIQELGEANCCANLSEALQRAHALHAK